ncbi:MAG: GspH/FimT family pseudopilin [Methylophilaceae bacterium]
MLTTRYIAAKQSAHQLNASKSSGFGLVEVMVTVAIIGVLMGYGLPSYTNWLENSRVRNVAGSILNGLQKARASAVTNNALVTFTLGANNSWTIGCPTATATCPALIDQYTADGSSGNITATTTPANKTTITYSNLGTRVISAAVAAISFNQVDVASSNVSSRALRVVVGTSGSARMCDPAFSLPDPKGC